jgi:hypothetical protein
VNHPVYTDRPNPSKGDGGDDHWVSQLGGIASRDGLVVASMRKMGALIFIDAHAGKVVGEAAVDKPARRRVR